MPTSLKAFLSCGMCNEIVWAKHTCQKLQEEIMGANVLIYRLLGDRESLVHTKSVTGHVKFDYEYTTAQ